MCIWYASSDNKFFKTMDAKLNAPGWRKYGMSLSYIPMFSEIFFFFNGINNRRKRIYKIIKFQLCSLCLCVAWSKFWFCFQAIRTTTSTIQICTGEAGATKTIWQSFQTQSFLKDGQITAARGYSQVERSESYAPFISYFRIHISTYWW